MLRIIRVKYDNLSLVIYNWYLIMKNNSKRGYFNRVDVFGALITPVSLSQAVFLVEEKILENKDGGSGPFCGDYICVCPVSSIIEATDDPEFREIVKNSFLSTPDGMPVVWYIKRKGYENVTRVYGPDLMREVFYISEEKGYLHYFYGGTEEILFMLKEKLLKKFPRLNICGMYAPPFRPLTGEEEADVISNILENKPDIVWVGIGSPKQEKWMSHITGKVDNVLFVGVGAAFNFYAGTVKQAPVWMQKNGLEWLFRLICEPGRLWKRYLYGNSKFIYLVLKEMIFNK